MKIGVMGIGNICQKAYVPIMNNMREQVEWHFYSRQTDKIKLLANQFGWDYYHDDWDAFLNSGIEACFIHTPTPTHARLIELFLNKGIHVFVDKPVSEDSHEVTDLHKLASEKGLILMTGFNRRFAPLNQTLKALPNKRQIISQKNRMLPKQLVKFHLFDMMIHMVDTTLYLLDDDIITVDYRVKALKDGKLQRAMIIFETASTTAIASINMEAGAHTETLEVQTTEGTYIVDNLVTLTKNEKGNITQVGFGDWENTLVKRGFNGLIMAFLEAVESKRESCITTSQSSIASHYYVNELLKVYDNKRTT